MTSHFSRREFLQTSATAAGALVASNAILLESDRAMASTAPVPPSDRLRFASIGVGMQGSPLLDTAVALSTSGRLTAVCADTRDYIQTDRAGRRLGKRALPVPATTAQPSDR